MKHEYMDTIFEGSRDVIHQITGIQVQKGEVKPNAAQFLADDVSVKLGIKGSINGKVFFSMDRSLAFKMAGSIMGQVQEQWDEITQSCLAELGNMIMGYTSGILFKKGIETDITTPDVITESASAQVSTDDAEAFMIPVVFEDGQILRINTFLSIQAA